MSYPAEAVTQSTALEMLINIQKLVDEFKVKLIEMEEEIATIKIENNILRNKIRELTSTKEKESVASSSQRRGGCFGYGADEF